MDVDVSKYIPNTLVAAPGEMKLGEKLSPFLGYASDWFEQNFASLDILKEEESDKEEEIREKADEKGECRKKAFEAAMKIIVAEAYRLAVPQLDLVLTANGFATVDSKNVVPASKARTDRLLEGILQYRDRNIMILLNLLPSVNGWLDSSQAGFFRQSLFTNPQDLDYISVKDERLRDVRSSWDRYLAFIPMIVDVEDSLADDWFSPELMSNLRRENLSGEISRVRKNVALKIKNQVKQYFYLNDFKSRRLADILNVIRSDAKNFPEWVGSATSENFFPPKFINKKNSTGYFF